jgi:alpha-D-ribose 1-methylphosphonate 5-triphosphate synthase subunit PhnH
VKVENLGLAHAKAQRRQVNLLRAFAALREFSSNRVWLDTKRIFRQLVLARACGVWTYEPREDRKVATAVCFAIAAVTLALSICDLRLPIYDLSSQLQSARKS